MKKPKKSQFFFLAALSLMLSGCGIYNRGFECPPGKGVGCVPTSEVLDMIVEKESNSESPFDDGESLFVPDPKRCQ